ncbi:microcystin-dependent protein [Longilinea arvoryzae]|uniref:Microcystin-dependent protein n=1 Tax=Longilinea arvoryzae TaxID=360412 RepID=A0A0S7BCV0_9CHLR|nr:tail fiber protein [Longilinea arvoryzae]GAP12608.1 microcystin-dependent protein [Longilinea arvoryzae]
MADPYIGEIRLFGGNFAPPGWRFCDGQLLSISEYEALFTLIGTTYGGDGQETFALPNLCGRFPLHTGAGGGATYTLGQLGGVENVPLAIGQMPAHTHTPQVAVNGEYNFPDGHVWASWPGAQYTPDLNGLQPAYPTALGSAGGSQPHNNMPPYLAVSFIIAFEGLYPLQS